MIAFDLIGQTPLVLLESFSDENVQIYAKLEQFNPGGSVKDRLGKYLVETAIKEGRVSSGDTIVEATAGNTGIGLAIAANRYHLNCVIFAPEGFSEEKISIMRALGADIKRTPKAQGMIGAQTEARRYARDFGAVYMNQFETEHNPAAYTHTLGKQLTDALPNIDYFVAGVGSGGTFTGVAQHLKQYNVKNVIVEPEGSILNGGEAHAHDIEGIGSEKWPIFLERSLVDHIITVSDNDGFENVKRLAQQEGLLVGSSSGAALQGALDIKNKIDKGVIVTIFPDGSDRYMSKKIFDYKGE
ncbi:MULTISPECIES: PLP-dependent cysteine synthase family protein [Staphylococcus]|uniref:Cysteine synthase family protein n=1 Tax=Staphylococcus borealis TaxID=2742203 RepID=A0ABX2LM06_9STAP|nr:MULTISPECIES: cysteine synthase family protein [Staphylococcus]RIO88382.1 cysteine synthase family protein [Staphylococcus haemolyticus]MCQ9279602.1 cysteine synthase family protein [Staphylococcus borealis]MDM7883168.1 cysteine synthase family protein [Staphylococcus borealis]MDY4023314.1 cysteine synthase family protein [Staphylococcus borealis]MEB6610587.1 cysteine synthase family protein [Staphylococcus borealis]